MTSGRGLTISQLSGNVIETIDAPESDLFYVLRRRNGEHGAAIHVYSLVYSSYMPSQGEARVWADDDRVRQAGDVHGTAEWTNREGDE